jgi:hypothetical protein
VSKLEERKQFELNLWSATPRSLVTGDGRTFNVEDRVATVTGETGTIVGFSTVRMLAPGHSRPENEAIIVFDSCCCSRIYLDSLTKV